MKAAQLTGIRQLIINDVAPADVPSPGNVIVAVKAVGICGSDVHNYLEGGIGARKVVYPFIPGHEASGEVIAIGDGVTHVVKGDRVMIEPAMHCGKCDQCEQGRFNTCRKIQFLSSAGELQGCMCERVEVPAGNCFPLPDGMPFDVAAAAEPLSIAVYSVQQSIAMSASTPVLILGAGPIGLCTLLAAKQAGAERIYVTDRLAERLKVAESMGACWTGHPDDPDMETILQKMEPLGMPVVFECCGKQEALDQAVRLLKPGGKLIITGIPEGSEISLNIDIMRRNELTIYNVRRQNQCVTAALDMLQQGSIDVMPLVTHHFPLTQAKQAFDMVAEYADGVIKAIVCPDVHED